MSRVIILALFSVFLGCSTGKAPAKAAEGTVGPVDDPRAAIVGRWTVDPARVQLDVLPPEQRPIAKEMAQNVMNSMAFEFTDKEYKLTMTGRTYARAYEVVSVEGQVVTIKATDEGDAEVLELEFGKTGLELRAPGERPLPLRPRG